MPEASAGPLAGKKVRVVKLGYLSGKEGLRVAHNIIKGEVSVQIGDKLQKTILEESAVSAVDPKWQKPCKWKNMVLSRDLKQKILSACGGLTLWMEDSAFLAPEPIELVESAKPKMLLDSHLLFGWELLRWHFSTPSADHFSAHGYLLLDPLLSGSWLLENAEVAPKETLEAQMRRLWQAATGLFCPIFCNNHWSLLVLKKPQESAGQPTLYYFDSMAEDSEHFVLNADAAAKVLKFLLQDEQANLPPVPECQMQESDDCGFWTLAFCLELLALWRFEGPRSRGQQKIMVYDLKSQLSTWLKVLKAEQTKSQSDLEKRLKNIGSEQATLQKKAKALAKTVAETAAAASEAAKLADLVYNKNKMPTLSDLPPSSKMAIEKIRDLGDPGVCSRCRYASGCLACSVEKAERYHLNLLRHSLGLPKLCPCLSDTLCEASCFRNFGVLSKHTVFQSACCQEISDADLELVWLLLRSLASLRGSSVVAAVWCGSLVHATVSHFFGRFLFHLWLTASDAASSDVLRDRFCIITFLNIKVLRIGNFRKIIRSYCDCLPIIAHVQAPWDLLTIKILKGRIKNLYCQNREILGSCQNYLKLLHALYNCASNIIYIMRAQASLWYAAKVLKI